MLKVEQKFVFLVCMLLLAACGAPSQLFSTTPSPTKSGWTLRFDDEFDGTVLDSRKWNTCYWWAIHGGCTNEGNKEPQWYQADDILLSGDGILRLRAQKRNVISDKGKPYGYTSGMIASHDKFAFTYGYVEIRAKVPIGKAMWPAFWLLPARKATPPEIDVLEILGERSNTVRMTLHYANDKGEARNSGKKYSGPDFAADFHTFAIDWRPERITWYVDGEERYQVDHNIPHEPMYLVANLAAGGAWYGYPDATTPLPAYFEIDYIRVYQPDAVDK